MKPGETRNGTAENLGRGPVNSINSIKWAFLDSSVRATLGMEPGDTRNGTGRHPGWNGRKSRLRPHQFHQVGQRPINSINSVDSPLSGEGVPVPCSVSATGPVSRDTQEFGISQACRSDGLEVLERTIFGAPKCLQFGRAQASELLGRPVRG